jgi:ERCC4-type nuclease
LSWQVDIHEPADIAEFFKQQVGTVEVLPVGDYVYNNVVGFERKSDDFLNYPMVLRQTGELKAAYPYAYLVVEKDLGQLIAAANKQYTKPQTSQILGMVASLCVRGTPPIFCSNQHYLIQIIKELAEKSTDGKIREPIARNLQTRKYDPQSVAISVLLGFPNLGTERAKMLLYRYHTLRDALSALLSTPDELRLLPGFGDKIVSHLVSALDCTEIRVDEEKKDEIDVFDER